MGCGGSKSVPVADSITTQRTTKHITNKFNGVGTGNERHYHHHHLHGNDGRNGTAGNTLDDIDNGQDDDDDDDDINDNSDIKRIAALLEKFRDTGNTSGDGRVTPSLVLNLLHYLQLSNQNDGNGNGSTENRNLDETPVDNAGIPDTETYTKNIYIKLSLMSNRFAKDVSEGVPPDGNVDSIINDYFDEEDDVIDQMEGERTIELDITPNGSSVGSSASIGVGTGDNNGEKVPDTGRLKQESDKLKQEILDRFRNGEIDAEELRRLFNAYYSSVCEYMKDRDRRRLEQYEDILKRLEEKRRRRMQRQANATDDNKSESDDDTDDDDDADGDEYLDSIKSELDTRSSDLLDGLGSGDKDADVSDNIDDYLREEAEDLKNKENERIKQINITININRDKTPRHDLGETGSDEESDNEGLSENGNDIDDDMSEENAKLKENLQRILTNGDMTDEEKATSLRDMMAAHTERQLDIARNREERRIRQRNQILSRLKLRRKSKTRHCSGDENDVIGDKRGTGEQSEDIGSSFDDLVTDFGFLEDTDDFAQTIGNDLGQLNDQFLEEFIRSGSSLSMGDLDQKLNSMMEDDQSFIKLKETERQVNIQTVADRLGIQKSAGKNTDNDGDGGAGGNGDVNGNGGQDSDEDSHAEESRMKDEIQKAKKETKLKLHNLLTSGSAVDEDQVKGIMQTHLQQQSAFLKGIDSARYKQQLAIAERRKKKLQEKQRDEEDGNADNAGQNGETQTEPGVDRMDEVDVTSNVTKDKDVLKLDKSFAGKVLDLKTAGDLSKGVLESLLNEHTQQVSNLNDARIIERERQKKKFQDRLKERTNQKEVEVETTRLEEQERDRRKLLAVEAKAELARSTENLFSLNSDAQVRIQSARRLDSMRAKEDLDRKREARLKRKPSQFMQSQSNRQSEAPLIVLSPDEVAETEININGSEVSITDQSSVTSCITLKHAF